MIHNQASVPSCKIPRSKFDLSNRVITTFEPDVLMPFCCYDVLPGDTFNLNNEFLLRFNNITHPFLDNMYVDTFFFFVPYRLIWDNWTKLLGEQENPGDSTDYVTPKVTIKALPLTTATPVGSDDLGYEWTESGVQESDDLFSYSYECSLYNYLGIPLSAHFAYDNQRFYDDDTLLGRTVTNKGFRPQMVVQGQITDAMLISFKNKYGNLPVRAFQADKTVNSLRFRAYNLIWNEWFRDENLEESVPVPKGDGPDNPAIFMLLKRGKRHDYFTSCLPWPQKGPAVLLPLGGVAPVVGNGKTLGLMDGNGREGTLAAYQWASGYLNGVGLGPASSVGQTLPTTASNTTEIFTPLGVSNDEAKSGLVADLSLATASTVNQLREAFAIQRLYEKRARGGTRYFELLESQYGVVNPDLRLQRPEYLGGSSLPFQITQVPQTAAATEQSPQGNLAAYSATFGKCGFTHSFGEFGVVIGLMSVRADLSYQQGISRHYFKSSMLDYYNPSLAFLGEQAVLNEEIYVQGDNAVVSEGNGDKDVFGYQERWAEYRYEPSLITGYMSSVSPESLDNWHLAQEFDLLPKLNSVFIQERVPVDRIKQQDGQPSFMIDIRNKCYAARPLPTYSIPGLIDHF